MTASGTGILSARRPAAIAAEANAAPPAPSDLISLVSNMLVRDHRCHAVLVYGSRARGDHTPASDLDIMGLRNGGTEYRWAAVIDNAATMSSPIR